MFWNAEKGHLLPRHKVDFDQKTEHDNDDPGPPGEGPHHLQPHDRTNTHSEDNPLSKRNIKMIHHQLIAIEDHADPIAHQAEDAADRKEEADEEKDQSEGFIGKRIDTREYEKKRQGADATCENKSKNITVEEHENEVKNLVIDANSIGKMPYLFSMAMNGNGHRIESPKPILNSFVSNIA